MIVNLVTIQQRGRPTDEFHSHTWVSYEFIWTGTHGGTQRTTSVICPDCGEVRKIEKAVITEAQ